MDKSKLWMLLLIPIVIVIGIRASRDLQKGLAIWLSARSARKAERERIKTGRAIKILTTRNRPTIYVPRHWFAQRIDTEVRRKFGVQPTGNPHNWHGSE